MITEKTYITKDPLPNLLVRWNGNDFYFLVLDYTPYEIELVPIGRSKNLGIRFSRKVNGKRVKFSRSYHQFYKDFFGVNPQEYRKNDKRRVDYKNKLVSKCKEQNLEVISEIGFRMDDITLKCEHGHLFTKKPHHILNSKTECGCTKCQGWTLEYTKNDFLILGRIIIEKFGIEYLDHPQSTQHLDLTNYDGPTMSPLRRSLTNDRGNENCWQTFWDSWDDFRNDLGIGHIEKRQNTSGYKKEDYLRFFMMCVEDLKRIPIVDEFRRYKCDEFNGSSLIGHLRNDYLNYVKKAKELTGYDFDSKFFIVDDIIVKSLREVYFVNFCKLHSIVPQYEPERLNCGSFVKEPDFYFDDRKEYFEVAGIGGSSTRTKKYWDKLHKSKPIIESMGFVYTIWDFSGDYTSLEFYNTLCNHFNLTPSDVINSESDILKVLLSYENDGHSKIKKELQELLENILNIDPNSKEQKKITSHIKRLNYKNQQTAAEILGVNYNCNSNGHIIGKNSLLTENIKNGKIFKYIKKNPNMGLIKICEKFGTTLPTLKKYWNSEFNPYRDEDIKNYHSNHNQRYTMDEFIKLLTPIIKKYGCVPTRDVLESIGMIKLCRMADTLMNGLNDLKRNEIEEGDYFYIVKNILGDGAPFDKPLDWDKGKKLDYYSEKITNFWIKNNIELPKSLNDMRTEHKYKPFGYKLVSAVDRFSNGQNFLKNFGKH
jgi:hypothetical protein